MYKPYLNELPRMSEIINSFGGFDSRPVINENEFSFTENMSSSGYPILTPRNKRGYFGIAGAKLNGLFAKSELCYMDNGVLYYGGEAVKGLSFSDPFIKRTFVSMGAKLLIFPDKVYFNTADFDDYGSLEAFFETKSGTAVTCSLCKADSELYGDYTVSSAEPKEPENGDLWLDTSIKPNALKQFSEYSRMWYELAETYVKISATGIGKDFNQYDGVELDGFKSKGLNGNFIIFDKGDDYITVSAIIEDTVTQTNPVRISREIPDMDFVCENANRLWGCSSLKNEIYVSKLGDPSNFNCFMGISTDSYAVSVGTDGHFTGAVNYRGYTLFFKENCVHKIYGSNPPYSVNTSYIRGVQKGSEKSLLCLNETLYYKSPKGICAFEGGVPVDVSKQLGGEYYTEAVAGALGDKYYICMSDKNGKRVLFVYDTEKALWHREENIDISEFATHNYNLYYLALINDENHLCLIDGENVFGKFPGALSELEQEENFNWSVETGLWGLGLPENKYYSSLSIRLTGEKGAEICVCFQTDSDGKWEKQLSTRLSETGSFTLPFITPRCDHLQIKISGKGKVKIYSISRKTEVGSELNV